MLRKPRTLCGLPATVELFLQRNLLKSEPVGLRVTLGGFAASVFFVCRTSFVPRRLPGCQAWPGGSSLAPRQASWRRSNAKSPFNQGAIHFGRPINREGALDRNILLDNIRS